MMKNGYLCLFTSYDESEAQSSVHTITQLCTSLEIPKDRLKFHKENDKSRFRSFKVRKGFEGESSRQSIEYNRVTVFKMD